MQIGSTDTRTLRFLAVTTDSSSKPWGDCDSPYEQIGGDDTVRRLTWRFYDIVEASSPVLVAMLPADTSTTRQKLYEFLSGWMGGPPLYWQRHGHPALRMRHAPFPIDETAALEWSRCMHEAIDEEIDDSVAADFLKQELGRAARQLRNRMG